MRTGTQKDTRARARTHTHTHTHTHRDSLVVPISLSPRILLKQALLEVDARLRRAAARFNAIIVPFGGVGSADNAPRHFASAEFGVLLPHIFGMKLAFLGFETTLCKDIRATDWHPWRLRCG